MSAHELYHFMLYGISNMDQEQSQDVGEPSLGGRGMMKCTCAEAQKRYQDLLEPHRDPSWRMPSFAELTRAERESKEAMKEGPV